MPTLNFVLPHWMYWSGLILFPLFAAFMYRRERKKGGATRVNLPVAYLFLVTAGYAGVHRVYLKSAAAFFFIPVFLAILYCNDIERDTREAVSKARKDYDVAARTRRRAGAHTRRGHDRLPAVGRAAVHLHGGGAGEGGIIEDLFEVAYRWLGGIKGGLASATVIACTLLAAMVGVVGATEVTMGMIALPAMLRRGYEQKIACGSLLAGGTLGILIPPSVMAIVYAVVAQQSLGELLVGSVFPGLLLAGIYVAYVTIRSYINPALGPALPLEERASFPEKLRLLKGAIMPLLLILLVLGVIFFGIATLKATAMVMWIFFGATLFVGFFILKGGQTFVADSILGTGLPAYGILFLMMAILFVLGMFLDWVGILLLTVPILKSLSFTGLWGMSGVAAGDVSLWYGVIFMVNMQMAFLSPPFGYSLFYLKAVAPKEITMATIIRSALPFLCLQALGLFLCIVFPDIVLWLPRQLYAGK